MRLKIALVVVLLLASVVPLLFILSAAALGVHERGEGLAVLGLYVFFPALLILTVWAAAAVVRSGLPKSSKILWLAAILFFAPFGSGVFLLRPSNRKVPGVPHVG